MAPANPAAPGGTKSSRLTSRRIGRRPGEGNNTREYVLAAARETFAERGYTGTTLRVVADAAGVDLALVSYYFGSKDGLFTACLQLHVDPAMVATEILTGPIDGLPERLTRLYFSLWEDSGTGPGLRAIVRSAATHHHAAELLREFLRTALFAPIAPRLGVADAVARLNLASAQLIGVAFARYIVALPDLSGMSTDALVAWVTPSVGRYLLGPAPGPQARPALP